MASNQDQTSWKDPGSVYDQRCVPGHTSQTDIEDGEDLTEGTLLIVLRGTTLAKLGGVIVESWGTVVHPPTRNPSQYRKYCEMFTAEERSRLRVWHNKIFGWERRTGYPIVIAVRPTTVPLLHRACEFFRSMY